MRRPRARREDRVDLVRSEQLAAYCEIVGAVSLWGVEGPIEGTSERAVVEGHAERLPESLRYAGDARALPLDFIAGSIGIHNA